MGSECKQNTEHLHLLSQYLSCDANTGYLAAVIILHLLFGLVHASPVSWPWLVLPVHYISPCRVLLLVITLPVGFIVSKSTEKSSAVLYKGEQV